MSANTTSTGMNLGRVAHDLGVEEVRFDQVDRDDPAEDVTP